MLAGDTLLWDGGHGTPLVSLVLDVPQGPEQCCGVTSPGGLSPRPPEPEAGTVIPARRDSAAHPRQDHQPSAEPHGTEGSSAEP